MKHFYRVASGIDTSVAMQAIQRQPELWNANTFRTTFPNTPHADVDDIWLRFSDPAKCTTTTNVIGDDSPVWHSAAAKLPQVKPLVLGVMRHVEAYELGRLLITRLRPGGRILPHADKDGSYVQTPDRARYHLVLQGLPGSLYHNGGETVCMRTGDLWWFNPHEVHAIENNSEDDRVHLLIDVRTWS